MSDRYIERDYVQDGRVIVSTADGTIYIYFRHAAEHTS